MRWPPFVYFFRAYSTAAQPVTHSIYVCVCVVVFAHFFFLSTIAVSLRLYARLSHSPRDQQIQCTCSSVFLLSFHFFSSALLKQQKQKSMRVVACFFRILALISSARFSVSASPNAFACLPFKRKIKKMFCSFQVSFSFISHSFAGN